MFWTFLLVVFPALGYAETCPYTPARGEPRWFTWQRHIERTSVLHERGPPVGVMIGHAAITKDRGYTLPVHDTDAAFSDYASRLHFEVHDHEGHYVVCSTIPGLDQVTMPSVLGYSSSSGVENNACRRGIPLQRSRWSYILADLLALVSKDCSRVFVLDVDLTYMAVEARARFLSRTRVLLGDRLVYPTEGVRSEVQLVGMGKNFVMFTSRTRGTSFDPAATALRISSNTTCDHTAFPVGTVFHENTLRFSPCGAVASSDTSIPNFNGAMRDGEFTTRTAQAAARCGYAVANWKFDTSRLAAHRWAWFGTPDGMIPPVGGTNETLVCVDASHRWTRFSSIPLGGKLICLMPGTQTHRWAFTNDAGVGNWNRCHPTNSMDMALIVDMLRVTRGVSRACMIFPASIFDSVVHVVKHTDNLSVSPGCPYWDMSLVNDSFALSRCAPPRTYAENTATPVPGRKNVTSGDGFNAVFHHTRFTSALIIMACVAAAGFLSAIVCNVYRKRARRVRSRYTRARALTLADSGTLGGDGPTILSEETEFDDGL